MIFLFGLDDTGKQLKKALQAAGADMKAVKPWLKSYMFVRRNVKPVAEHYHRALAAAKTIESEAEELERMLIGYESLTEEKKKRLKEIVEDLQKRKAELNFEFVIGEGDKDVLLTIDSVRKLSESYRAGEGDPVILQSETENLIALMKERLNKEKPDLFLLACYYRNHTDQELQDKSDSGRLIYVNDIFHAEFAGPILPILTEAREKALEWDKDAGEHPENYQKGRNKRLLEQMRILLNEGKAEPDENQEMSDLIRNQAPEELLLRRLCTMQIQ